MLYIWILLFHFGWTANIDPMPIREFIDILNDRQLPAFEGLTPNETDSKEHLPREVWEIFDRLNNSAFQRPLLQLKTCTACRAAADLSTLTIYISPRLIRHMAERATSHEEYLLWLHFVLSHEIGHYIYELATARSDGRSPNGNLSFRELKNSYSRCTIERQKAHLEVDLIGVVLMERLGMKNFRASIVRFLDGLGLSCDGHFRMNGLKP